MAGIFGAKFKIWPIMAEIHRNDCYILKTNLKYVKVIVTLIGWNFLARILNFDQFKDIMTWIGDPKDSFLKST